MVNTHNQAKRDGISPDKSNNKAGQSFDTHKIPKRFGTPRRFRLASRSISVLLSLALLLCALVPACVRSGNLDACNPSSPENDFSWKGPDLESMHTRIEVAGQPNLTASTFWMRGCGSNNSQCLPDQLTAKWDSYIIAYSLDKDVTCDFSTVPINQNNEDCELCNHCIQPTNCHNYVLLGSPANLTVTRVEGFVMAMEQ